MLLLVYMMIGVMVQEQTVAAESAAPLNLFGTKNSYNASLELWPDEPAEIGEEHGLSECCQPIQVIGVYRHGMRYPSSTDIDNAVNILRKMKRQGVDSETVGRLQSVVTNFAQAGPGQLADPGRREQRQLGRRISGRHPRLLHSARRLDFFTSSSSRAADSQSSFERGLTEELSWNAPTSSEQRDDLLRFYDACPRYISTVKKNETAFHEFDRFRQDAYPTIKRRIARRLTLDQLAITDDELDSLYQVAAIEVAVLGSTNWARLLDLVDIQLLEYAGDLKQFYKLGYGHAINGDISCPLISHIFRQMDEQIKANRSRGSASFYFGHSGTVLPLFTALGLFRDRQPLTAVPVWTSSSPVSDRQFRTSRIDPMSTNLVFTLYRCADCQGHEASSVSLSSAGDDAADRYMLRLDMNERPINWPLPGVIGSAVQSYSDVRTFYSKHIDRCRFNKLCAISAATLARANVVNIVFYVLLCASKEL